MGQDVPTGGDLQHRLAGIKGNHFAKSALDLAWWDINAKRRNEPLWKTLEGRSNVIDVGADFGVMESIDLLLDTIADAVKSGFKRIKLKYRPGWDWEMVAAVRAVFPETVFHIDCNSGYTLDSLPMFKKLDQYGLAMIEQPLAHDDLVNHADLQRQISTPICLDESITSVDKARKAIQIGACRWINIKPGRVGGLTNALAIHNLCAESELRRRGIWVAIPRCSPQSRRLKPGRLSTAAFRYVPEGDVYLCPQGRELRRVAYEARWDRCHYRPRESDCRNCHLRLACSTPKTARTVIRYTLRSETVS